MFVPRTLRLKGVREKKQLHNIKAAPGPPTGHVDQHEDALVQAMEKTSTRSPAPEQKELNSGDAKNGPRFTAKPVTAVYISQLAAGIELIFTDYAHQEETRSKWLQQHYRTLSEGEHFVHLSAILEHPNIHTMKPEASQMLLRQALHDNPSTILETSHNGYYVRRKPSSYPPIFLPANSFEVVNDDGLSFWDQRTIYVEPHLRNIAPTPARVAYWLKEHGQLRPKWLPIQAVHTLWNSCAFVVLSGNVMHDDVWQKWREAAKPEDWKIMTKVEHTRRTAEYVALLVKQNPGGMRKTKVNDNELPAIARPAVLAMNAEIVPAYSEATTKGKRKRKKKKTTKSGHPTDNADANTSNDAADEVEEAVDNEPSSKRRA